MTVNEVPAGWYPDPEAPERWRYWDGTAWTGHVSSPVSEPATTLADPATSSSGPVDHTTVVEEDEAFVFTDEELGIIPPKLSKRASRRNQRASGTGATEAKPAVPKGPVWTKRTLLVFGLCIVLVIAGVVGSVTFVKRPLNTELATVTDMVEQFIDASRAGDTGWQNYATDALVSEFEMSAPLFGDAVTAHELDLSLEYEILDVQLNSDDVREAYYASALVWLTYDFTVVGEPVTHETVQKVWLTRPFFEGETADLPHELDTPDAVASWRITALSDVPMEEGDLDWPSPYRTTLVAQSMPADEAEVCGSPLDILERISTHARQHNTVPTECAYGDEIPGIALFDTEEFAEAIPVIDAYDKHTFPPELTGLQGWFDEQTPLSDYSSLPLMEFAFPGADDTFVVTMSVIDVPETSESLYRIISVERVEALT